MQQNLHIANNSHEDYYALKLLASLIILLSLLAYTSFYLIQNYYSKSFFDFKTKKTIYFLTSNTLKSMYNKNGMDFEGYNKRVNYFKELCQDYGYEPKNIYSDKLISLEKNSKLIALDMMSLSSQEIDDISTFVSNSGKLIFNFTSGFLDNFLKYQNDNLVSRITNLKLSNEINTIKLDAKTSAYLSTRLASPITKYLPEGHALDMSIYDPLPIYNSQNNLDTDGYLTNWSQTNYIKLNKDRELNAKESALIWHGYKDNGKWIYFSFPSYVFMESKRLLYAKLFRGMLEYLDKPVNIVPYPYIDAKNIIFVSEDTEYKYENLKQFYNTSLKHNFPVTAFCVANLAKKHAALMKKVSKSSLMEIGSHSYTHKNIVGQSDETYKKETIESKKLLYDLTKKNIIGFRAPREEIDRKMIQLLENDGFKYILNKAENRLSPYFNEKIMIIPRHATDDYSYLINLDWSAQQILDNMKKELDTIVNLDALYTLSTHTHLMTFGSNIKIVDKFFEYVNTQKHMNPMNGEMLFKRIFQKTKMNISSSITAKKIILNLTNNNSEVVNNIHYEIDINPKLSITNVESEIIGLKTELTKISHSKYLLIVKSMKPKSKIVIFLNYDKNN